MVGPGGSVGSEEQSYVCPDELRSSSFKLKASSPRLRLHSIFSVGFKDILMPDFVRT